MLFYNKYLKYKIKYLLLKGGGTYNVAIYGAKADKIIKNAMHYEPFITKKLNNTMYNFNKQICELTLVDLKYRIKSKESLVRKLISDDNELKEKNKTLKLKEKPKEIYDVLRYTYIIKFMNESKDTKESKDISECIKAVDKLFSKDKDIILVKTKNTFCEDKVYKGLNRIYSINGYKFELQFHTEKSIEVKMINHKLYEDSRKDNISLQEKERLKEASKKNSAEILVTFKDYPCD